tara:strand:+ start:429 stop:722 length:294 start_codon:yes stop_codon:yes gene_type:complete
MWLYLWASGDPTLNDGSSSQTSSASPSQEIISLEAEIPEALFGSMQGFLQSNPQWDQYQLVSSALASFLFQNGSSDSAVAQHYLNGLFSRSCDVAAN